ncbi:MAG: polysaccharide deacetylase family protein [Streptococcaceae bacterium]|nr:polysaccharide deacetylase family protein [Streptococcaceae bacterium]
MTKNKFNIIILSLLAFLIIGISASVYFTNKHEIQQSKETLSSLQSKVESDYLDKYYPKNITDKDIDTLKSELAHKKNDLISADYKIINDKITLLSQQIALKSQINSLFTQPVITGQTYTEKPLKEGITTDNINKIDVSKIPQDKFSDLLNKAKSSASSQLSIINQATSALDEASKKPTPDNIQKAQDLTDKLLDSQLKNLNQASIQRLKVKSATADKAYVMKKKLIALTFDDGPNPATTPLLLNELQKENVKVTFFSLGQNIQANPDIIKREAKEGNEIASHTWDHKDLTTLSPSQQLDEITGTQKLIKQLTGQDNHFFRPPYGSINNSALNVSDNAAILWSIDARDWARTSDVSGTVQAAVSAAHPGAIIIMHDIHLWSVQAVPQIIKTLKSQGYTFVTVSQLLQEENGAIQTHKVYSGW